MTFLQRLFRQSPGSLENPGNPLDPLSLIAALGGRASVSGVTVNENTALRLAAVHACIRVLSETVASLPLILYRRLEPRGKERATTHQLHRLLHDAPNPLMTSYEWREVAMVHLLTWGNHYSEIIYDGAGRVQSIWPLRPDRMEPPRIVNDQVIYRYRVDDETFTTIPMDRVFHVRNMGDSIVGWSPIRLARESIGLGLAAEEFGSRFFANDARPSGVLQHPETLTDDAMKRLRESWNQVHGGLTNAQRVAILEEGMSYETVGLPPEDAQWIELRKYETTEIAGIYRVPLHLIGNLERATFSNIEQQSLELVKYTLRPWLVRFEQRIQTSLISIEQRNTHFAEFLVDGLLRGDIQSRYQAYAVGRQNGWLSANDIRELENMNPLPDDQGEAYLVNGNMQTIEAATETAGVSPLEEEEPIAVLPNGVEEEA